MLATFNLLKIRSTICGVPTTVRSRLLLQRPPFFPPSKMIMISFFIPPQKLFKTMRGFPRQSGLEKSGAIFTGLFKNYFTETIIFEFAKRL